MTNMPGVSIEQVHAAKEIDLLTYLQANEPGELKKSGSGEYRTATHSSLVISNGFWFWYKAGFGGKTALDFLIKVRGMGFVAAVETILGGISIPALSSLPVEKVTKPQELKNLYLPKRVSVPHKVVKYLGKRGIHSDIIGQCLKLGILYEGIYKNPKEPDLNCTSVCVFIGRDEVGEAKFAAMRGINNDIKRNAPGSDRKFAFVIPAECPTNRSLAAFEETLCEAQHKAPYANPNKMQSYPLQMR